MKELISLFFAIIILSLMAIFTLAQNDLTQLPLLCKVSNSKANDKTPKYIHGTKPEEQKRLPASQ